MCENAVSNFRQQLSYIDSIRINHCGLGTGSYKMIYYSAACDLQFDDSIVTIQNHHLDARQDYRKSFKTKRFISSRFER